MRYTIDTCLFNDETAVNSPCIINYGCEPLEDAVATGLSDPGEKHYDYCTADDDVFMDTKHWACVSCLQGSADQVYLSNCSCKRRAHTESEL